MVDPAFALTPHPVFARPSGPVCLIVLDGVGLGPFDEGNAWHLARTPVLDALTKGPVYGALRAHGPAVGLPAADDIGNSEVGHNALGAGRIFDQGAKLVQRAIADGSLFAGDTWRWLVDPLRHATPVGTASEAATLHLVGLWSDGNVHAHVDHAYALIERALADGVTRIRLHLLLDGRDVGETSALDYLAPLEARIAAWRAAGNDVAVASGGGRMKVTMDRYEADWSMVERGWHLHVRAEGRRFASASEAVKTLRVELPGTIDQNLPAFVVADPAHPDRAAGAMHDGDSVVFFNFRGDRAIEISRALEGRTVPFDRGSAPAVRFAGMMQYDGDTELPKRFLVSPPRIDDTLGELLVAADRRQLAVSETQKFGHVTYFFNGNNSQPFSSELERWIEIPSDRVDFSERPWMKAAEITDATLAGIDQFRPDFVRVNYANGDMVGHTGQLLPAIIAMEAVDLALGRLLAGLHARGATAVVLADHGNCEEMIERDKKTGKFLVKSDGSGALRPKTSHTTNPVPCAIVGPGAGTLYRWAAPGDAGLSNVAATCLELLGFKPPAAYRPSLIAPA